VVTPDVACTYPAGSFGELDGNLTGLLTTQKGNTTPFTMENDTAPELYVTGNPSPTSATVRTLERDTSTVTASNPYSGNSSETIANYLADPTEEAILHIVNADPARTPTFALFAKPDYYLFQGGATCSGPCVTQNTGFAWDHGDYAAEINNNWLGVVGPGVRHLGIDGFGPAQGPSSAGPNSGQETSVMVNNPGTWIDETDVQPTLLYLAGLRDDYVPDGRVITPILSHPTAALAAPLTERLAVCYKQLNASVGEFGAATLITDTNAVESSSPGDATYLSTVAALRALERARDALSGVIKVQLTAAAFSGVKIPGLLAALETAGCGWLINRATDLAASTTLAASASAPALVTAGFLRLHLRRPGGVQGHAAFVPRAG
jgi:hypothetical protein